MFWNSFSCKYCSRPFIISINILVLLVVGCNLQSDILYNSWRIKSKKKIIFKWIISIPLWLHLSLAAVTVECRQFYAFIPNSYLGRVGRALSVINRIYCSWAGKSELMPRTVPLPELERTTYCHSWIQFLLKVHLSFATNCSSNKKKIRMNHILKWIR